MLEASLGKERAGAVFDRVRRRMGPSFRFMHKVDPHQAAALLREESPAVAAAVLTQIDPAAAARILACFPAEQKSEIALRIARMSALTPDVMEKVRASLEGKLDAQGRIVTRGVDGRATLAAIVKAMGASEQESLLAGLGENDPDLAAAMETRLFGVETALEIPRRQLAEILSGLADRELALVARSAGPAAREALLGAVSPRRREIVESEEELAGDLAPADLARAAAGFAALLRTRWREGRLELHGRGEELA
jgi:flagellar motor switch protein FliG